MRFTDNRLTGQRYQRSYLRYIDEIAPEVKDSLISLSPKYEALANGYDFTTPIIWWLSGEEGDLKPDKDKILAELSVKKRYQVVERLSLQTAEATALMNFYDLRQGFAEFIQAFSLETREHWLRRDLFNWLGQFIYQADSLGQLELAHSSAWVPRRRETLEYEAWRVEESSEEFDARFSKILDQHRKDHHRKMESEFRQLGFKRATKKLDLSLVKWLVYWNVKGSKKEEILQMITNDDPRGEKAITQRTLNAHFRRFKNRYDLPLREG
jgi:hypothetical protein